VDLLHEFNTSQDAARIVELLEAEHRLNPSLDASVILFHDVVQVLTRTDFDRVRPPEVKFIPHAHSPQRRMARLKAVERDRLLLAVRFSAFRKNAFAATMSRVRLRCDPTVLPRLSTARYRYIHRPPTGI
jgi:hypothetical protein